MHGPSPAGQHHRHRILVVLKGDETGFIGLTRRPRYPLGVKEHGCEIGPQGRRLALIEAHLWHFTDGAMDTLISHLLAPLAPMLFGCGSIVKGLRLQPAALDVLHARCNLFPHESS